MQCNLTCDTLQYLLIKNYSKVLEELFKPFSNGHINFFNIDFRLQRRGQLTYHQSRLILFVTVLEIVVSY